MTLNTHTDILNEIKTMVKAHGLFFGPADESRISEIQAMLNVILPRSYQWFLNEFGHGGVFGVEINGNGLGKIPTCVRATLEWRKYGLPPLLVVVEDDGGDWIYCLDTSNFENDECPVVDWEQNAGIGREFYKTFAEFFIKRIQDSYTT